MAFGDKKHLPVFRNGLPIRAGHPYSGLGRDFRIPSAACPEERVQCCNARHPNQEWQAQVDFVQSDIGAPIEEPVCHWHFMATITKIFEDYEGVLERYEWRTYKNCELPSLEEFVNLSNAFGQQHAIGCCDLSRTFDGWEVEFNSEWGEVAISLWAIEDDGSEWLVYCNTLICDPALCNCGPGCVNITINDFPPYGDIERVVVPQGYSFGDEWEVLGRNSVDLFCCTDRYGDRLRYTVDAAVIAPKTLVGGAHILHRPDASSCYYEKVWDQEYFFPHVVGCGGNDGIHVIPGYVITRRRSIAVSPFFGGLDSWEPDSWWTGSVSIPSYDASVFWWRNISVAVSTGPITPLTTCFPDEFPVPTLTPYWADTEGLTGDPTPCLGRQKIRVESFSGNTYDQAYVGYGRDPDYIGSMTFGDYNACLDGDGKCGNPFLPDCADPDSPSWVQRTYSGLRLWKDGNFPCYTMDILGPAEDEFGNCPDPPPIDPIRPPGIPPLPRPDCNCGLINIETSLDITTADTLAILGEPEDAECPPGDFAEVCPFGKYYYQLIELTAWVRPRYNCTPSPELTDIYFVPGRLGAVHVCRESLTLLSGVDDDPEADPALYPRVKAIYTALLAICKRNVCPEVPNVEEGEDPYIVVETTFEGCEKKIPLECQEHGIGSVQCCSDADSQVSIAFPQTVTSEMLDDCPIVAFTSIGDCGWPSCAYSGNNGTFAARVTISPDAAENFEQCCSTGSLGMDGHAVQTGGAGGASIQACSAVHYNKVSDCVYDIWRCFSWCTPNPNLGGGDLYIVVSVGAGDYGEESQIIPCQKTQSFLFSSTVYSP